MNTPSKIMLSADEQQLVSGTAWILTKHKIMHKVNLLLGDMALQQQKVVQKEAGWLPQTAINSSPKISKGENYLQLPYMILDYPRCFTGDDIFAVRTMFWWGNFFSVTLHLSGIYKMQFQQKIIENIFLMPENIFICINENQWQHQFEADNYKNAKEFSNGEFADVVNEKAFVKLAVKFSLQPWDDLPQLLAKAFDEMIMLLKN